MILVMNLLIKVAKLHSKITVVLKNIMRNKFNSNDGLAIVYHTPFCTNKRNIWPLHRNACQNQGCIGVNQVPLIPSLALPKASSWQ